MLVIKNEPEFRLVEMAEALKENHGSWRAQIYRFAMRKDQLKGLKPDKLVFGILNEYLSDKEGSIFFLNNDDVVVLCKSVNKRTFDDMAAELDFYLLDEKTKGNKDDFNTLYDLSINWEEFYSYCRALKNTLVAKVESGMTASGETVAKNVVEDPLAKRMDRAHTCILLVEDDPFSLRLARKALDTEYYVVTASDGRSALEAYRTMAPDVVFLDIGLPDSDGQDVLKEILKIDPHAYVVMLSGNCTREQILRAMRNGAKGFVGKPFIKSKLQQYIQNCPTARLPK